MLNLQLYLNISRIDIHSYYLILLSFLALDKCEKNKDYLQILEFNGHTINNKV